MEIIFFRVKLIRIVFFGPWLFIYLGTTVCKVILLLISYFCLVPFSVFFWGGSRGEEWRIVIFVARNSFLPPLLLLQLLQGCWKGLSSTTSLVLVKACKRINTLLTCIDIILSVWCSFSSQMVFCSRLCANFADLFSRQSRITFY